MKNTLLLLVLFASVQFANGQCLVNISHSDETCFGDCNALAVVNVIGGGPSYTYSWIPAGGNGPTAGNLCAGTYTCIVSDGALCFTATTVTITQPTQLNANICISNNVSCNGGNNGCTTVCAGGGTAPYAYMWSPVGSTTATACNLPAGNYTVTVTDANGCMQTATATITQPTPISTNIGYSNVLCYGQCNASAGVTTIGGTPPYSYIWNPSGQISQTATGLCAGCYTVTVTDLNGCSTIRTACITQPTQLLLSATQLSPTSAYATVTGGVPAYAYTWTPTGQTGATATNLPPGNYTCCVYDANGCSTCSIVLMTAVDEINLGTQVITVYPNPFHLSATLVVSNAIHDAEVSIYDVLGKEIQRLKIVNHQSSIRNLSQGIYLVRVRSGEKEWVQKLVVQ